MGTEIALAVVSSTAAVGAVLSSLIAGGVSIPAYWNGGRHLMAGPQFAVTASMTSIAIFFAVVQVGITLPSSGILLILGGVFVLSNSWLFMSYRKGYLRERLLENLQLIATVCAIGSMLSFIVPQLR